MKSQEDTIRIDATYGLAVKGGDKVRQGDVLSDVPAARRAYVSPVRGTIERIRLDGEKHEFVISISPACRP